MVYTIGTGWFIFYSLLAFVALLGGVIWALSQLSRQRKPFGGGAVFLLGILFVYLALFAGTHFRVDVNEKALLIDTINQEIIGVRESGVQRKPLFGVRAEKSPANTQYKYQCSIKPGTETAVSAAPLRVPLLVDATFWLDLSQMDLEAVYRAYNGVWEKYVEQYLDDNCQNVIRQVTVDYTPNGLEENRGEWELTYGSQMDDLLSSSGFGVEIDPMRIIMSWDFSNPDDATAYDEANRTANLITRRMNEKAALDIEAQMSEVRASMVVTSTTGLINSMRAVSDYMSELPPELREPVLSSLSAQVNMEYLRLVEKQSPEFIFPPNGGPMTTFDTSEMIQTVAPSAPVPTSESDEQ